MSDTPIRAEADTTVQIKIGDQMVDITSLGDMLIEAGERFNDIFKPAE